MKNLHGIPGLIQLRVARSTKTPVAVYAGKEAGLDTEDGTHPYSTVCMEHEWVICHTTLTLAKEWASHPEDWCEECMAERKGA